MRFTRQKSDFATDIDQDEPEARRRNRLSKPLTSKITTTNISTTNLQEPVTRSKNVSTIELATGGPLSSHPSNAGLRRHIRSEVFDSDQDSPSKSLRSESSWGVAYMVSQIDKNTVQDPDSPQEQPPVSPLKPKKRKSLILRRLSSRRSTLSRSASNSRLGSLKDDATSASTPSSSIDRIIDAPSIPPTRRASFTPGTATRKPSRAYAEEDITEESLVEEKEIQDIVDGDYFDWQPPRPPATVGRVGTPADLDYSHLGGFRHGSLQIVNGRASPAFSELSKSSKQLLSIPKPQRTISSNYGEVDDFDHAIDSPDMLSLPSTPNMHSDRRNIDWESNEKQPLWTHPLQNVVSPGLDWDVDGGQDEASVIAHEYMAELAPSPYSERKSGSLPGSVRRTRSEGVLRHSSSISSLEESASRQACLVTESPVEMRQRSPSPTGSVVWRSREGDHFARGRGMSRTGFHDENLQPCEDRRSWYSSTASQFEDSPLGHEIPVQVSPTRLQLPRAPEKSDSGYSSSNSLRSVQMAKKVSPTKKQALQNASESTLNIQQQDTERGSYQLVHRPSFLKSRKTSPNLRSLANLDSAALSTTALSEVPQSDTNPIKSPKVRKRLQKKRPQSQPPGKISISGTHSLNEETVPRIPSGARENLRVRALEVPELEQTYQSHHQLSNQPSISSMDLLKADIRFPSPTPEPTSSSKRPRSFSRPRSWIGRPKEDRRDSKRDSGISQLDAMGIINDFGTVASSLGGSPYDPAHANIVSEKTMNPYNISTIAPRPRYMMDDRAAAELSRIRSRAVQERDAVRADRRSSFNDRGGIPGRSLRPTSFASDAPPITPDMLQKAYRTSSEQRQWSMSHVSAPPPPVHSPRPSYVEYQEDTSPTAVATPPPPPSHSPRPVDVSPDPWAEQAAAWRARRQSIGAALSEQPAQYSDYDDYNDSHHEPEEPIYPEIPPRQYQHRRARTTEARPYAGYYPPHQAHYEDFESVRLRHAGDVQYGAYQHRNEHDSAYMRQSRRNSMMQNHEHGRPRRGPPLPASPKQYVSKPPHPYSNAGSARSQSSLAEELHPDLERPHPPPQFGRYSGGLSFDYEAGKGFGGSTGTRSFSGKAEATRREVPLRASFGVDLGDVPVLPHSASWGRGY
ncbi:hypothetical protein LTS07_009716 [Exophiala sideris]|uniref:Proteophosphoglycan ppg4 n=1 Tax=Exophiala sideris TaxID=1016849 RepID=A0ABR0J9G5_9EURO|nr:hypothetical protein LTS07_009716 [Exophiala sideris]KAK5023139.1 hypothetical protein LTR13_011316 [Exophiala sideris]KAK5059367.1 hypothetical protein LTR69_005955 [Exophiala sideris]